MLATKSSLMLMRFRQLWARMLSMLDAQFPLILRVVATAMTFTTDTSGCERPISLATCRQSSKAEWGTTACALRCVGPLKCIG